ncbi:MAG TPA: ATP-binding protein [Steroidobacteraceae bacterium]|nr:ATP-binding protein [Steroidobacteraceae bacterium]
MAPQTAILPDVDTSLAIKKTDKKNVPAAGPSGEVGKGHFARFYIHDETLVDAVVADVTQTVRAGAAAIVIATGQHLRALEAPWAERHFDAPAAAAEGQLLLLEAAQALAMFMVDGTPDRNRFMASIGQTVARASEQYGRVAVFGEMVSVLWADGKPTAALELESLSSELMLQYPVTVFCAYSLRDCMADGCDAAFEDACAAHTHVIPAETCASASVEAERRTIALLQRKVLAMELRLAANEEVQRSLADMAAIVENSDDAIIGKTLDGVIRTWNTGAQHLFGYAPAEAIGSAITLIVPPELLDEEQRILATLRDGRRIEHYETTRLTKDRRRIEISLTVSPVRDASGAVIGASKIARDITDRKRAERLLREAHADLQSRMAELARFNAAAVDRETRILALKQQVNALRARLGEDAEYSFDGAARETRAPVRTYSRKPAPAEYSRPPGDIATLDCILTTGHLSGTASRAPDLEAENSALATLAQALADGPDTILQVLAKTALGLLHSGSAGLSLLTQDRRRFWWAAVAGEWSTHLGAGTPRDFGPSGDVLERDAPLLFTHWDRRYPYLAAMKPPVEEALFVPFYVGRRAVGTIWAMTHDGQRKFDAEDLRLLQSLARFASAAYQAVNMLGEVGERRAALSLLEDAVQARALAEDSLARLRDSEEQLRQSEEALRDADHRKDEFLALLAHELRNPLAPIRYALAASRKAERTPEQRRRAEEIMERQVTHMSRLLDDLLDISRVTRGKLELKKVPAELTSVLSAAIETARPLLDAKQHTLSLEFPREAMRLEADPVRLAQVFSNLLINAAKYTDPHGKIHLDGRREGDEIVVSVRDNGIGISAQMMPRLFTMFAQEDGIGDRTEGGLGVGLALVRGLVALHGGTLRAYSEGPGHGSEFVVRLPVNEPTAGPPQLNDAEDYVAGIGLRVLVADDNRDAADTCAALLESCGHHIQTAYSGRQALELAEIFRPHAMLLDIGLPDLSGYVLAKRIRESSWGRRILLVAITGWGQDEDRRRAYEAGFDHHLAKPVAAEAIESALRMLGGTATP